MPGSEPRLDIAEREGALVVAGEVDAATAPTLEAALAAVPAGAPLVVDVAGVSFMDSTGLSVLIDAQQQRGPTGLTLRRPSEAVRRLLEITGLDQVFVVEADDAA